MDLNTLLRKVKRSTNNDLTQQLILTSSRFHYIWKEKNIGELKIKQIQ